MTHETIEEIPDEEWEYTFRTNVSAMFYLCKAALPHMNAGGSIIGSSSVNSDMPSPTLAPYAATKAAIANFCASLAQLLGERGIRVNSVAPGPIWTPLIPATMPEEKVAKFGENVPLGRAGQPVELAPIYVLLASDEASFVSGARVSCHRRPADALTSRHAERAQIAREAVRSARRTLVVTGMAAVRRPAGCDVRSARSTSSA